MRLVNRKGEVSYNPAAVVQEQENPEFDYWFSSRYPTLRVNCNRVAYTFTEGRLVVEDETEAMALKKVAEQGGMFSYDGKALRTGS